MTVPSLYPFQKEGVRFLAKRRRAYLADKMGLGKTVQAIVAADEIGVEGRVIVCPASAVPNWWAEIEKWGYVPYSDSEPDPEWAVLSYASLIRRDWKSWQPDLVILDEAHYAKTPSAKRTRAALGLARQTYKNGGRAWLLSGTPMPNDPTELWPPVKYLWPEIAAEHDCTRATQWMYRFCMVRPTLYGPKPYVVRNGAELRESLSKIMLRRTLDDVSLELPPLRVELSRLPKGQADVSALEEYEAWEGTDYTSTLRRLLGAMKAPLVLRQIVEELDDGAYEKIVVLYHHRDVGDLVREGLTEAGIYHTGFGGETPQSKRQEAIEVFQKDSDTRAFVAQQTAAGIAINLTAANEVVLMEPAWTPSDNEQAIKRVHRIGQDSLCRARIFALSGTLDEAIMGTIANKAQMIEEVGL